MKEKSPCASEPPFKFASTPRAWFVSRLHPHPCVGPEPRGPLMSTCFALEELGRASVAVPARVGLDVVLAEVVDEVIPATATQFGVAEHALLLVAVALVSLPVRPRHPFEVVG